FMYNVNKRFSMKNIFLRSVITLLFVGAFDSCSDMGTNPKPPAQTPNPPALTQVFPDSGFAGDTVTIRGTNFGTSQGSSTLKFSAVAVTEILSWQDTIIIVKIPDGTSGTIAITVTVSGSESNAAAFTVLPAPTISFANDVEPLFVSYGCTSCHGGTNNLFVDTYAHLMAGNSLHGPVVTPGNGEGSVLIKKLRGTASFGVRMPQGGPYLPDSSIAKISTWITQGAKDN
ncbi:MAG: IPT/TIG domain-containing protein, partial [Bacteroidota bacterium]|nr:IPT/TIG domain-containing protein [Bacteroidota bacterium]